MNRQAILIKQFLLFALFLFLLALRSFAQSDILIAPTHIILDSSASVQQIRILNTGSDTVTYKVSLVEMRMKDNGKLEPISLPDPGQRFASSYLAFIPDKLVLIPGETQVLTVRVENAPMDAGEYRSHLLLKKLVNRTQKTAVSQRAASGITLPVIVRTGALTAKVEITDMSIQTSNDSTFLYMTLRRDGNMSVYGDIEVNIADAQGSPLQVGNVKGVAVYTPNLARKFRIPLKKIDGFSYHFGKLNVAFKTSSGDNTAQLAQSEMVLNR